MNPEPSFVYANFPVTTEARDEPKAATPFDLARNALDNLNRAITELKQEREELRAALEATRLSHMKEVEELNARIRKLTDYAADTAMDR